MMMSVLLHAGAVFAANRPHITANSDRNEFFSWWINGLHLAVTPAFFVISGFVLAHMIAHTPLQTIVRERVMRLGFPLISVALTFNLIELYLRYRDGGGRLSFLQYVSSQDFAHSLASGRWQLHLWFIVILLMYSSVTLLAVYIMKKNNLFYHISRKIADWIGGISGPAPGFVLLVLTLGAANLIVSGITSRLPGAYDPLLAGLPTPMRLAESLPYFCFGLLTYGSSILQRSIFTFRPWMMLSMGVAFAVQPYPTHSGNFWQEAATLYAQNIVCWILVFGGLQFCHRFSNAPNSWRKNWIGRAQSMYLFHHMLVYAGGSLLVFVNLPPIIEYVLLVTVVVSLIILFHDHVIKRVALVGLFFNGRLPRPQSSSSRPDRVLQPAE